VAVVARADLLERKLAPAVEVVERGVAGDPQEPGGEGTLALLVSGDRADQPREHALGYVLGLVAVADDALDMALHVIGVADVEEVQGAHVALLGAGDRLRQECLAVGGGGARGEVAGAMAADWFWVADALGHGR
jgi:hypothetical protein